MGCSNGSEPKLGAPEFFIVNVADSVCALYGQGSIMCQYAGGALGFIPNAWVHTATYCSSGPSFPDSLTIADFPTKWYEKVIDLAKAQQWSKYCQCKPDPNQPSSKPYSGGNCECVAYEVFFTTSYHSGPVNFGTTHWGPISGIRVVQGPDKFVVELGCRGARWSGEACQPQEVWRGLYSSSGQQPSDFKASITSVRRIDGKPDDCPDPLNPNQPRPEPDPLPPPPAPPPNLPAPPPPPQCVNCPPGPRGEKGDTGNQGIRGEKGADGNQGLPGRDGIDGRDGRDGIDGSPGPRGAEGARGDDGRDGSVGPKGDKGDTGERGNDGAPGTDAAVNFVPITVTIGQCVDFVFSEVETLIDVLEGTETQAYQDYAQLLEIRRAQCRPPDYNVGIPLESYTDSVYTCIVLYFYGVNTNGKTAGRYLQIPNADMGAVLAWVSADITYKTGSFMGYVQYFDSKGPRATAYAVDTVEAIYWRDTLHDLSQFTDSDIFWRAPVRQVSPKQCFELKLRRATYFADNSKRKTGRQTGRVIWEAPL